MKRRESREVAVQMLYEKEINKSKTAGEIIISNAESMERPVSDFAKSLFRGACDNAEKTDALIAKYSQNRRIPRISKVPLAVLRLAIYELSGTDTDLRIVINEALEICRKYSGEESVKFVNGVLKNAAADLKGEVYNSAEENQPESDGEEE